MKKILLLIMAIFLLTGCIKKLNRKDYEAYLVATYGDLKFEYVSKNEACDNARYQSECMYFFTTPELNGVTFHVEGRVNGSNEKQFIDLYIKTKYNKQLKEYYATYFETILQNGVEIINIEPSDYEYMYNIPNMSFDNYLKYLEEKYINIQFSLNIPSTLISDGLNTYINTNYDIQELRQETKNIIYNNELNYIKDVSIYFNACEQNSSTNACSKTISLYEK